MSNWTARLASIALVMCFFGCSPSATENDDSLTDRSLAAGDKSVNDSTTSANSDTIKNPAGERHTGPPNEDDQKSQIDPIVREKRNRPERITSETNDANLAKDSRDGRGDIDDPDATPVVDAKSNTETKGEPELNNGRDGAARPGGAQPTRTGNATVSSNTINPLRRPTDASLKLPDEFKSLDKDGDGQLGAYEWPRAKLSEFSKLDKNGDGFLNAQELGSENKNESELNAPSNSPSIAPTESNESRRDESFKATESGAQP